MRASDPRVEMSEPAPVRRVFAKVGEVEAVILTLDREERKMSLTAAHARSAGRIPEIIQHTLRTQRISSVEYRWRFPPHRCSPTPAGQGMPAGVKEGCTGPDFAKR